MRLEAGDKISAFKDTVRNQKENREKKSGLKNRVSVSWGGE